MAGRSENGVSNFASGSRQMLLLHAKFAFMNSQLPKPPLTTAQNMIKEIAKTSLEKKRVLCKLLRLS